MTLVSVFGSTLTSNPILQAGGLHGVCGKRGGEEEEVMKSEVVLK
jgi:hypothetical protein